MPRSRRTIGPIAIGYARAGRDELDDEVLALERQVERVEAYARFRGLQLENVFRDEAVPGSVPLEARPGGIALAERIAKSDGRAMAVITLRLERLFGSADECLSYHEAWEARDVGLHVLDLAGTAVDTHAPAGRLMLAVLAEARAMENTSHERGTDAFPSRRPRKKGEKPLLGERVVRGYIVPDPVELHAVQRIGELAKQGKSLRLIAEALDQEGIPTKRRARGWSKEAIRLIQQRVSNGEVRSLRASDPDNRPADG